ncbi:Uncharacterized protein Adt_45188 [Abeliophyllum distichum]|uniref:Uncharacterized protein n=1 Tax=Abeliophyllum distichum TaxID=126358 RepID=A0ABD1PEE3_9LAMI
MAARITTFLTLMVMLIISDALAAQPASSWSQKQGRKELKSLPQVHAPVSHPSKKGGVSSKSIPKAYVPTSQPLKKGGELPKSIPKAHAPTIQPPKKVGNSPKILPYSTCTIYSSIERKWGTT